MNVEEAISRLSDAPPNSTLVAKAPPFTWGSEAMFVELTEDYRVPEEVLAAGWEYLLEVDEIETLLAFLRGKKVGSRTVAEFIIHYAVHDCPPSWIDDVPDIHQSSG